MRGSQYDSAARPDRSPYSLQHRTRGRDFARRPCCRSLFSPHLHLGPQTLEEQQLTQHRDDIAGVFERFDGRGRNPLSEARIGTTAPFGRGRRDRLTTTPNDWRKSPPSTPKTASETSALQWAHLTIGLKRPPTVMPHDGARIIDQGAHFCDERMANSDHLPGLRSHAVNNCNLVGTGGLSQDHDRR